MEAAVDQFFKEIGDIVAPDPGKDHEDEDEVLEHPYGKYIDPIIYWLYVLQWLYVLLYVAIDVYWYYLIWWLSPI